MSEGETSAVRAQAFGRGFLTDIWYFAALASDLKRGRMARFEMLGEPVLIGRTRGGEVFALRDVCPHRAAPLSAGRLVREAGGAESVECPYHGWRFSPGGGCVGVPSIPREDAFDVSRVAVRRYPAAESQGMIFVWMGEDARAAADPPPPPTFPGVVGRGPRLVDRMEFAAHVDHAVVGLMDPAHGPLVHQQWRWRSRASAHEKAKRCEPAIEGFVMTRHPPRRHSPAYALLGA